MPRSSAAASEIAPDDVPAQTWAEDKNPTRPLPKFRLEEEARRLDRALANEDQTVTVTAEQNRKLLASVFADASAMRSPISERPSGASANTDDEPTLDAPAPAAGSITEAIVARLSLGPQLVRAATPATSATPPMTAPAAPSRPPALKTLVITRPMPVAPIALDASMAAPPTPPSGLRLRITPELARAARDLQAGAAAADAPGSAASGSSAKPKIDTYVVAGLWATAAFLVGLLMFIAT